MTGLRRAFISEMAGSSPAMTPSLIDRPALEI